MNIKAKFPNIYHPFALVVDFMADKTQFQDYVYKWRFCFTKINRVFFLEHGLFDNMEINSNADASNMRKSSKQDRKCTGFWSCFKFYDVKKIVPIK